jgi:hypothetical protein
MSDLNDLVNIVITLQSAGISKADFGTPLVLATLSSAVLAKWGPDVTRSYKKPADMLPDGFTVKDAAYKLVSAFKSQSPNPPSVVVGKRVTPQTQVITLTPTNTTVGYVYGGTISGSTGTVTWTHTVAGNLAAICTAIATAINTAAPGSVVASGSSGTAVVCTQTTGFVAEFTGMTEGLTVSDDTPDPTSAIATDLAAVNAAKPGWYGLAIDSFGKAEIEAVAAWVEANKRALFVAQTSDTAVIASTYSSGGSDVGDYLKAHGYKRTALFWNQDLSLSGSLAVGCLSVHLTQTPGSDNWQYTNVTGAAPSDQLTATKISNLVSKNTNYYQTVDTDARVLGGGVVAFGEYADTVRGIDWWFATAQRGIVGAMLAAAPKKIPYTDAGVQRAVVGPLNLTNKQGIQNGLIATTPAPIVSVPLVRDVSPADKAARNFPDVGVTFTLAGAINTVDPVNVSVLI